MSDQEIVRQIEALAGRPVKHRMEGGACVALALTDQELPAYGIFRHASDQTKTRVLDLVSRLGMLEELDLRQNWLRHLPDAMASLRELRWLDAASNYLGTVPDWLYSLERLEHLNLGVNELTSISPELGRLNRLKALYLHKNALTSLPREIEALAGLGVLNLYLNRFPDFPAEMWALGQVHTFAWGLSGVDYIPEEMSGWPALRFVTFAACKIRNIDRLSRNVELAGVRVHKNMIEGFGQTLCSLRKLRQITLYQNQLQTLPEEFRELESLEMLSIAWNRFAKVPDLLWKMPRLRWVAVHDNPLPTPTAFPESSFEIVTERPFFSTKMPMWNRLDFM